MPSKIINLYKPAGLSPLEAINLFRLKNPEHKDTKMTYAGRLDPIAEGVLIILAGEEIFEKDKYLKLDKEYEAEIVFGFFTDTHDPLGMPEPGAELSFLSSEVEAKIKTFVGDFSFSLPPYSSYKVKGKPLFKWAREGRLAETGEVKRTTQIYSIELAERDPWRKISAPNLLKTIAEKINLVKGDFRQDKIKGEWEKVLEKSDKEYVALKIKVRCSSGTYIRSLADELGKKLGTEAILLSLKRNKVGEFLIKNSVVI